MRWYSFDDLDTGITLTTVKKEAGSDNGVE